MVRLSIWALLMRCSVGMSTSGRITEYAPEMDPNKFFAAMVIPLPDPLILIVGDEYPTKYGRFRDELECESVELTEAPIQDAHEVLKTEECERVLSDVFPAEDFYRGIVVGNTSYSNLNRQVVSEFKRWLVKLDDPESVIGYTLMVVESFAPEYGNARWHEAQWERFYPGPPDVTEGDCPPGDWRDIVPRMSSSFDNMQGAYDEAARRDYLGDPPGLEDGMAVHPTGGGKTRPSGRFDVTDTAMGWQIHQVDEGGPDGCVATARLVIRERVSHMSSFSSGSELNPNVDAFSRRMVETDPITIAYARAWARSHIWYKREEQVLVPDKDFVNGTRGVYVLPDIPNSVGVHKGFISYRESDQLDEPVIVPSKCSTFTRVPSQRDPNSTPGRSRGSSRRR